MPALRTLSERPTVVVDDRGRRLVDPARDRIGIPGPLGRNRVVAALPTNKHSPGPVQLEPWKALVDSNGVLIADPQGNVIGAPAVWINRYLAATRAPDTRRL